MSLFDKSVLSIETSSHVPSIGWWHRGHFDWVLAPDVSQGRQDLVVRLQDYLNRAEHRLENLDALLVSRGPGAYTSLRMGLIFAQGLALSRQIPLISFCSTDVLAETFRERAPHHVDPFAVFIDARASQVIAQRFQQREGRVEKVEDYRAGPPQVFLDEWDSSCQLVGSGVSAWQELCQKNGFAGQDLVPDAQSLVTLWRQGQGHESDPEKLVPEYVRAPVG